MSMDSRLLLVRINLYRKAINICFPTRIWWRFGQHLITVTVVVMSRPLWKSETAMKCLKRASRSSMPSLIKNDYPIPLGILEWMAWDLEANTFCSYRNTCNHQFRLHLSLPPLFHHHPILLTLCILSFSTGLEDSQLRFLMWIFFYSTAIRSFFFTTHCALF